MTLKSVSKILRKGAFFTMCLIMAYLVIMFTLSHIPVNVTDKDPARHVAIYIKTNGVHTDIVLPLRTSHQNWTTIANPVLTISKDSTFQYAAFGWGDRDFYITTPQWSDLKIRTALNAAFYMGKGLMHVSYYHQLREDSNCRKVMVSDNEYKKIVSFVKSSFSQTREGKTIIIPGASYGDSDLFYEADNKYNLFYTCNSWANNALKAGGQRAALWTLTDTGILNQYN